VDLPQDDFQIAHRTERPLTPQSKRESARDYRQLLDAVRERLEAEDPDGAKALLQQIPPADAATVLEDLDEELRGPVFRLLDVETEAEVLGELEARTVQTIAEDAPGALREAAEIMQPDEVADVLEMLPDEQAEAILEAFPEQQAETAEHLMSYARDSAGGLMTTEFVVLYEDLTCREAIEITQRSREAETVAHLFVSGEGGRLVGYLPLQNLVFARPDQRVGDLMEDYPFAVPAETDQEELVRSATKYDLDVVAVVNEQDRLIGVVTVDDILEAAEEEVDEDMYRLAGTGERDPVQASVYRSARLRLPWLLLSVLDGLFIAFVMSRFDRRFLSVELLFFLPLIPLMGGQVAIQASTIMVRGIAVGSIRRGMLGGFLSRQFVITLVLSLCCALAAGLLGYAATGVPMDAMTAVSLGVLVAILIAGMMGMTLPLVFNALGIDPAVSAGPFITMLNDVICIFIYLLLGMAFVSPG
jgi:magnesium transporter